MHAEHMFYTYIRRNIVVCFVHRAFTQDFVHMYMYLHTCTRTHVYIYTIIQTGCHVIYRCVCLCVCICYVSLIQYPIHLFQHLHLHLFNGSCIRTYIHTYIQSATSTSILCTTHMHKPTLTQKPKGFDPAPRLLSQQLSTKPLPFGAL